MRKPQFLRILWAQSTPKILLAILLVSTGAAYWMWNQQLFQPLPNLTQGLMEDEQERFWFNLVVKQNISKLRQLPSQVLRSDSCFWLTQLQKIREANRETKVETLSKIMQSQMERVFEDVNCSKRLTLHCGHQGDCGFGCQLHHRAFCVLVAFTLGIPLIHNKSEWPFKSTWERNLKRLGSKCKVNAKTIFMTFSPSELPYLRFNTLCSENTCLHNRKVQLQLDRGVLITRELLDLLEVANHTMPFLWYVGQFIRYSLRFNDRTLQTFQEFEKDFAFNENHPVIGIQARRTDKIGETKESYHSVTEYMHVVKVYFQLLEDHQSPKTVFVASDDHTVLEEIQKMYRRPEWKILGFQSNRTMFYQQERTSGFALKSVLRDIYFLAKSDYVVCGLSSNICRLILEMMATRFHNIHSRLYTIDGIYGWPMWGLSLNLTLVPV